MHTFHRKYLTYALIYQTLSNYLYIEILFSLNIGERGFQSRVILSLGVMGLGPGQFEIFIVVFRPLDNTHQNNPQIGLINLFGQLGLPK